FHGYFIRLKRVRRFTERHLHPHHSWQAIRPQPFFNPVGHICIPEEDFELAHIRSLKDVLWFRRRLWQLQQCGSAEPQVVLPIPLLDVERYAPHCLIAEKATAGKGGRQMRNKTDRRKVSGRICHEGVVAYVLKE